MLQLIDIFKEISSQKSVRLAVLQSCQSSMFSHGMDPEYLVDQNLEGRKELFMTLMDLLLAADGLEIPLVADVNGPALAGGAVLALLGDYTIANDDHAKICFSEVKVGLPVPAPIFSLVRRRCHDAMTKDLLLLGRNVRGSELVQSGMVKSLYHSEKDRLGLLSDFVSKISRLDRAVVAQTLAFSKSGMSDIVESFRNSADKSFVPFLTEDYLLKGLKAIMSGERPKFAG